MLRRGDNKNAQVVPPSLHLAQQRHQRVRGGRALVRTRDHHGAVGAQQWVGHHLARERFIGEDNAKSTFLSKLLYNS